MEDDVRGSVLLKAEEIRELRTRTVEGGRSELVAAATALGRMFAGGGTLFAFGNGGSATDAMDVVADFRAAPQGWAARKAIDLTADSAILTALANDIGTDVLFGRQIIAYAKAGDAALALSTSGDSANIIEALTEARRRGLFRSRSSVMTGGGWRVKDWPTMWSLRNRSTSRGSRRHRPRPTTPCASSSSSRLREPNANAFSRNAPRPVVYATGLLCA